MLSRLNQINLPFFNPSISAYDLYSHVKTVNGGIPFILDGWLGPSWLASRNCPGKKMEALPVLLLLDPSSKSLDPEPPIFIDPIDPKAARAFILAFVKIEMSMVEIKVTPPP